MNNNYMGDRGPLLFHLIKSTSGERIQRLTEPRSGLSLKMKLTPADAVVPQKEKRPRVFEAALARVELAAA